MTPASSLMSFEVRPHSCPATPHMRHSLADGLFWTSVACCAFAQISILRSVIAARALPSRRASAIAWAALPAVALVVLLGFTWRAMHPPGVLPMLLERFR